ncbi:hypothetical protein NTE19_003320 [Vibrio fluvialis]|nr:hypothetical protein [Vibrio fluvialis]
MISKTHCSKCNTPRAELKEPPYSLLAGGIICQPCEQARQQADIDAYQATNPKDYDHYANDEIVCPECGHKHKVDCGDYELEGDDYECGNCERTFICTAHHSVSFQTKKKD